MSGARAVVVAAGFLGESSLGLLGLLLRRRPRGHHATFQADAVLPEEPPAHWGPPVEIGCCGRCGRRRPVVAGRYVGCGHDTA